MESLSRDAVPAGAKASKPRQVEPLLAARQIVVGHAAFIAAGDADHGIARFSSCICVRIFVEQLRGAVTKRLALTCRDDTHRCSRAQSALSKDATIVSRARCGDKVRCAICFLCVNAA